MIGHAVLGLVVGTDLLGTVAVADLALALGTKLCLLLLELHLVQTGAQHLHADLAVLDLGALLLRLHHGVGGQVGDTHGGVGGVNALTARARSAVSIDAQVGLVDLDVNLSASGSTATVAVEVWMRPWDSVLGTRWTRCTPDSNFMTE